jgi:hypothetical protein
LTTSTKLVVFNLNQSPYATFNFRITMDCLKSPPFLRGPEKVIDFDGHVIGMAIDPEGRYLYVNVRSWVRNENAKLSLHIFISFLSFLSFHIFP